MRMFRQAGIATKLFLALITGTLIPAVFALHIFYQQDVKSRTIEAQDQITHTLELLAQGAKEPLWNYSAEGFQPLARAALFDRYINQVIVYDENGKVFFDQKDPKINTAENLEISQAIFRDKREIGKVIILYSLDLLKEEAGNNFITQVIWVIFFFLTTLALTFLLVRLSILKKIALLAKDVQFLQDGNYNSMERWKKGDEIDELGLAFQYAANKTVGLMDILFEKNNELEAMVAKQESLIKERSEQLIYAAKMVSMGEMAGGISHEINNPLAIIIGKVMVLRKKIQNSAIVHEIDKDLQVIEDTVNRAVKIIKGLKQFARVGDSIEIKDEHIDTVISDTLVLCSEKFKNHGVKIEVECAKEIIIKCNAIQVSQALLNLLSNAFDAVDKCEERWVKVSVLLKDGFVEIAVIDSGAGIKPEDREKIMQPFFTTKEVGKGTGLGLSISKGIIEGHKGELFVDSTSKNTKIVIKLPIT